MKPAKTTLIIILAAALTLPLGCCKSECDKDQKDKAEAVKNKPEVGKKVGAQLGGVILETGPLVLVADGAGLRTPVAGGVDLVPSSCQGLLDVLHIL